MPSGPLFIAKTVCFLPVQKVPLDLTFTSYSLFDTQNCSAVSQFLWASGRTVGVGLRQDCGGPPQPISLDLSRPSS